MRKLYGFVALAAALMSMTGCGEKKTYEIACVTDVGQLMDGGFNQGTYEGVKNYAEEHGKTYNYYAPANGANATDADRIAAMELAIENGAKVIVTPGFMQENALKEVAKKNPDVKFVFVDGWNFGPEYKNITGISYKEEESGYLAGYAAVKDGYVSLGGTFGGGGTNPACNRYAYGYIQGANAAAAEMEKVVDVKVSFKFGSQFSASSDLQSQIAGWYKSGTEVVFSCGGSMLQSVKAACEASAESKKIIGVDVDQHGESERVITSASKGLTVSVEKVLDQFYNGEWDAKLADVTQNLGATDNATGLPTAEASWGFKTFTIAEYEAVFAKIKAGTITIDTTGCTDDCNTDDFVTRCTALTAINFTLDK